MNNPEPSLPDQDLYRLLVQEVKDYAIFMLDPNGIVMTWNTGAQRLKGYTAAEVIGQNFSIFYTEEDRTGDKPTRELIVAARDGRVEDEGWRIRKDGSRFWANVVISAIHDDSGVLRGFCKVTRDMTKERNTELELREAHANMEKHVAERTAELSDVNRELEHANRTRDEFLATLSHELRTPLTAIVGWVHMLRAGGLKDQQVKHALEVINRNLDAQTQLIDDLLNISRIILGKLKIEPQLVFPAPVVEEALESVKPSIEAKQLRLEIDVDETLGPIRLDPVRFRQIVWNLLSNAVKFTPREGAVRVTLKRIEGHAVFSVSDTGEGIAPEFLPYVFDRFRQADSSRSRKHGGLGLGLSIVRHLVELHGGSVSVESAGTGLGCTFSINFPIPVFTGEGTAERVGKSMAPARSLTGVRVLVLEDEIDTREMIGQALTKAGAVVKEAANAEEALDVLEKNKVDILISDIGMPDLDGYAFLRIVRKATKDFRKIPAIALTGYASEEDRLNALQAGFDAHIVKPVELTELLRTIAALNQRV